MAAPVDTEAAEVDDGADAPAPVAGRGLVAVWAAAGLGLLAVFWWSGRQGFNPTDEGMIAAASRRIAAGQVPHAGFLSPRPVGASIVHLPELLAPTPLLLTSRAVTLVEVAAAAVLLVRLAAGRPVARWGPGLVAVAFLATVVNLHAYPLMAWHTVDGILLAAVALWGWDRWRADARTAHLVLALAAAGSAVTIKQSFAPLAVLLVIGALRHRARPVVVVVAAVPGVLYVAWLLAGGAVDDAITQMGAAETPGLVGDLLTGLASAAGLVGLGAGVALAASRRSGALARPVAIAVSIVVVGLPLAAGLERGGTWAVGLFWAAAVALGSEVARGARPAGAGSGAARLGIVLVAWECCLSWGYPVPNLVGGSLAAAVLILAWSDLPAAAPVPAGPPAAAVLAAVAAVAAVVLVAGVGIGFRRADVYRSLPADRLAVDLGTVAADGRGILVDRATADHLLAIRACQDRYRARRVAVVPDNPAAYALLDLDSPLPSDWLFPPEIAGVEDRVDDALARAQGDDGALILFQVRSVEDLSGATLEPAGPDDAPFWYGRVGRDLGAMEACGPFLASGGAVG